MSPGGNIAIIGNFDGVHAGHQELVRRARLVARSRGGNTRVLAMVLYPHPATVLRPDQAPTPITDFVERRRLLLELGVDEVVQLQPGEPLVELEQGGGNLLELSPETFLDWLTRVHNVVGFVEGEDFRFGRHRSGDVQTLRSWAERNNGVVEVVSDVTVTLPSGERLPARSGVVRDLITAGRVADAAAVLGRPYEIRGTVVKGHQRGRDLGFPTLNVAAPRLRPADGVYAARATLPDGRTALAAVSIGVNVTFDANMPATVEAHLLDVGGPGRLLTDQEYGWSVKLRFTARLRGMLKFESLGDLIGAIKADCAQVRTLAAAAESGEK